MCRMAQSINASLTKISYKFVAISLTYCVIASDSCVDVEHGCTIGTSQDRGSFHGNTRTAAATRFPDPDSL